MAQYLPVLALLILAALFAGLSLVASKLLAPRNPTVEKLAPYECGIIPGREPPERFPVRFYLVAMLFVIFDIEIVFLYPWAVASGRLGLPGFLAILIFSALLFESFVYLISKGALDWGPLQVNRSQVDRDVMRSADRTSDSTIRRVGLEGRYEAVWESSPRSGAGNRLEYSAPGGRESQPDSEEIPV
ncbi:MAG: NADH-quinone oxidoreductase subunit A [Acidimicrobiia bacterium]|nr:NADH-quinone oxidoreductase subunit A [Acidimicrobiia bacterium]